MTVQEKKNQLIQLVEQTENEPGLDMLLEQAEYILSIPQRDILDDLTPGQLAGLQQAREQAQRGEGIPHSEYKKHLDQWVERLSGQIRPA